MWDTTHTHTRPVLGLNQIARIFLSFFFSPSDTTRGFHFKVFFFEGCFVLGFPGIECSGVALCAHRALNYFTPLQRNKFELCKCLPRLHSCSLNNPPDNVTSDHLICLSILRSPHCNTRLPFLLRHRYSHHLWQKVPPGLSELPPCPNPPVLSTPDPRGNCPCYTPCWETAGSQRGGRGGREGNCR